MKTTGSGDKILDWGVIIAAIMLFFKTADIFRYFAPTNLNDFVGWDVSIYYGITTALLVEGLALALHFNHRARASETAQIVKWVLLIISGACQIFDGFVVTKSISQLTPELKGLLSYGVPLIPLLIMVMVFGIGRLPDEANNRSTMPQKQPVPNKKGGQAHSSNVPQKTMDEYLSKAGINLDQAKRLWSGKEFSEFADKTAGMFDYISGGNMRKLFHELNPTNGRQKQN